MAQKQEYQAEVLKIDSEFMIANKDYQTIKK
jgi:hypothetical protein